ncbi:MAG: hypothetical protein ACLUD0_11640 [Eubacterium ramulus]
MDWSLRIPERELCYSLISHVPGPGLGMACSIVGEVGAEEKVRIVQDADC